MMNTSHNNVSGIKQKQDQRDNEINQVDRNPTFPTCIVKKRCTGRERGIGGIERQETIRFWDGGEPLREKSFFANTRIEWVPSLISYCCLLHV